MAKKKPENKSPAKTPASDLSPQGYEMFLGELKERIRTAQLRALGCSPFFGPLQMEVFLNE